MPLLKSFCSSLRSWSALVLALCICGCAGLPQRPAAPQSHAITDVADTRLARILDGATPVASRGLSGFRLLPEGETAFGARVALIRRAEKTIDAQYYFA